MGWKGSVFGGTIGAFLGGPIGAVVGAGVGQWLSSDTKTATQLCPHCQQELTLIADLSGRLECPFCHKWLISQYSISERDWIVILFALFSKLSKLDGVVSNDEALLVKEILSTLKLNIEDEKLAKETFKTAKDDAYDIYYYANLAVSIFPNMEVRERLYNDLWAIAMADNILHESEDKALKELPHQLHISALLYETNKNLFFVNNSSLDDLYSILGCDLSATDDELKKAYRAKVKEFHPDTIAKHNLPESFIEFANSQMKIINDAYDTIKKSRNL